MNIRHLALGSVASIALLAGSAVAADLPVRSAAPAPIYVAPIMTWSGFYVGAAIGAVASDVKITESEDYNINFAANGPGPSAWSYSNSMTQLTAGGYAGYNFQFGSFVAGIEGDVNARFGDGDLRFYGPYGTVSSDWDASIRLRLGFLVTPRALIYATGGVAFTEYSAGFGGRGLKDMNGYGSGDFLGGNRTGWTIGAGIEYALDSNWHMKLEYLYADYGSESRRYDNGKAATDSLYRSWSTSSKVTSNTVRVGLSYRFGGAAAAPVVARY